MLSRHITPRKGLSIKPGSLPRIQSFKRVHLQQRSFFQLPQKIRRLTNKSPEQPKFFCQVIQTENNNEGRGNKAISIWLYICAGLVFCMIVLGAVTRLTESGLSIVDWKPVTGAIPPITQQEWEDEFEKYKQFPEFKKLNSHMTLSEFKQIFFFEWAHRFLGRSIGIAFAVPFGFFWARGLVSKALRNRLMFLFGLGGLQGAIGWWMVKSGLKEDLDHPRVSPYRLATHLGSALVIYLGLLWTAMGMAHPVLGSTKQALPKVIKSGAHGLAGLIFLTTISGAFVAGLDAGLLYPTVPYMGESLAPKEYWDLEPSHKNFFENGAAVQFNHRVLATTTYTAIALYWLYSRRAPIPPQVAKSITHLFLMANVQVALGVSTLLLHVPVDVAATHQAGAVALLSLVLRLMHVMKR